MKRISAFFAALTLMMAANAQTDEAILNKIETANRNVSSLQAPFTQVKTLASKKTVNMSGTLYYSRSDRMAMDYTQPQGNRFVINGGRMLVANGKQPKIYTLASTPSMKSLADYLLNAMAGKVRSILAKNTADLSIQNDSQSENYVITLTAKTKQVKGFAKIVLEYNKKTGLFQRMEMEEFNHTSNVYTVSNLKTNVSIPEQTYKF